MRRARPGAECVRGIWVLPWSNPEPDALTDDWERCPPVPYFYQAITCQPHLVPERERAVIRAVQRAAWHRRRSWLFWFRLDPLAAVSTVPAGPVGSRVDKGPVLYVPLPGARGRFYGPIPYDHEG